MLCLKILLQQYLQVVWRLSRKSKKMVVTVSIYLSVCLSVCLVSNFT